MSSPPSLAITCNGPGEFAGWCRPLLRALYDACPDLRVHLFFVPDDYATGAEAALARRLFPQAAVYEPREYLRAALGRNPKAPASVDAVLYLGGDLMHASRLARRYNADAFSYKFSRGSYRQRFKRVFAVDMNNVEQLLGWRVPRSHITLTGNIAIDGALLESSAPVDPGAPNDGILVMPGSRRHEVDELIPFFFTMALQLRQRGETMPIAFGISPFTALDDVRRALERGGDPRVFARKGKIVLDGDITYLSDEAHTQRFPIVQQALSAATVARLVVTIPGTKTIELAALGKPMIACTPLNAPELITINGPLTYLDRVPLIGAPLKRSAVLAVAKRFPYVTQPNIDADEALIEELRGTLTPGHVAQTVAARFHDAAWLQRSGAQLQRLYRDHAGAAARMASALLEMLPPCA